VSTRTAEFASRPPPSLHKSRKSVPRSERIKRRRGLTLLTMTLVLPGFAQLVAGNRRLGRVALRIWAILWFLALLAALLALILPAAALAVVTFGPTLVTLQIMVITLGLGWVVLIVDAWRLAQPWDLERWGQIFSAVSLAMVLAIFGGFIAVASMVSAQHDLITGSALGKKVVQIALAEVGTVESPRGSDRGDACKYQGSGCPQAWCADFASWVYRQAGAPFSGGADGGWRIASSSALADYWKKNGVWIQNPGRPVPVNDPRAPQPGDVVWYPGHTNIVVSYDGKTVKTVGGNESRGVTVGTGWDVFKEAYGWGSPK
jgi:hypothetical protein